MRICRVKTFTGKWENADGKWEGFLEEVTFSGRAPQAEETASAQAERKGGADSSRKLHHQGGGGSEALAVQRSAWESSWLSTLELQLCHSQPG